MFILKWDYYRQHQHQRSFARANTTTRSDNVFHSVRFDLFASSFCHSFNIIQHSISSSIGLRSTLSSYAYIKRLRRISTACICIACTDTAHCTLSLCSVSDEPRTLPLNEFIKLKYILTTSLLSIWTGCKVQLSVYMHDWVYYTCHLVYAMSINLIFAYQF